jgi:hypothetical protein
MGATGMSDFDIRHSLFDIRHSLLSRERKNVKIVKAPASARQEKGKGGT